MSCWILVVLALNQSLLQTMHTGGEEVKSTTVTSKPISVDITSDLWSDSLSTVIPMPDAAGVLHSSKDFGSSGLVANDENTEAVLHSYRSMRLQTVRNIAVIIC